MPNEYAYGQFRIKMASPFWKARRHDSSSKVMTEDGENSTDPVDHLCECLYAYWTIDDNVLRIVGVENIATIAMQDLDKITYQSFVLQSLPDVAIFSAGGVIL